MGRAQGAWVRASVRQPAAPFNSSGLGLLTQVALCEHRLATIAAAVAVVPGERVGAAAAAACAATRAEAGADQGAGAESALQRSWEHWERLLGAGSALAAEVAPPGTRAPARSTEAASVLSTPWRGGSRFVARQERSAAELAPSRH